MRGSFASPLRTATIFAYGDSAPSSTRLSREGIKPVCIAQVPLIIAAAASSSVLGSWGASISLNVMRLGFSTMSRIVALSPAFGLSFMSPLFSRRMSPRASFVGSLAGFDRACGDVLEFLVFPRIEPQRCDEDLPADSSWSCGPRRSRSDTAGAERSSRRAASAGGCSASRSP